MPLRVIREVMADDPERAARLIELEDRILERAIEAGETRPRVAQPVRDDLRRARRTCSTASRRSRC